jgi:arsenate reductase-like glutaredoxin family protein
MLENPTLIKRPVIDKRGHRTVGFDDAVKKSVG